MLATLRRLTQRALALIILTGFGLSAVESLSCTEEQGIELASTHAAELKAATSGQEGPLNHCCPCVHTFVTTVRTIVVSAPQVDHQVVFSFLPSPPPSFRAEPLVPPPIA